jgi:hypothetical protein
MESLISEKKSSTEQLEKESSRTIENKNTVQTSSLIEKFEKLQKEKLSPRNSPNQTITNVDEEIFKKKQSLEAFFQKQGTQKPKINTTLEEKSGITSPRLFMNGELKKYSMGSKTPELARSPRSTVQNEESENSKPKQFTIKRETVELLQPKF